MKKRARRPATAVALRGNQVPYEETPRYAAPFCLSSQFPGTIIHCYQKRCDRA